MIKFICLALLWSSVAGAETMRSSQCRAVWQDLADLIRPGDLKAVVIDEGIDRRWISAAIHGHMPFDFYLVVLIDAIQADDVGDVRLILTSPTRKKAWLGVDILLATLQAQHRSGAMRTALAEAGYAFDQIQDYAGNVVLQYRAQANISLFFKSLDSLKIFLENNPAESL